MLGMLTYFYQYEDSECIPFFLSIIIICMLCIDISIWVSWELSKFISGLLVFDFNVVCSFKYHIFLSIYW